MTDSLIREWSSRHILRSDHDKVRAFGNYVASIFSHSTCDYACDILHIPSLSEPCLNISR